MLLNPTRRRLLIGIRINLFISIDFAIRAGSPKQREPINLARITHPPSQRSRWEESGGNPRLLPER